MSVASISIDRTSLTLSALVVADDGTTYRPTPDGIGRPGISWRLTAMPDSADSHGTEYVAAVKEQSSMPLQVKVYADSSAALDAACDALEEALSQFAYTMTVTVDGVAKTWTCAPASWQVSNFDSGEVAAHIATYAITVPVYPIAS